MRCKRGIPDRARNDPVLTSILDTTLAIGTNTDPYQPGEKRFHVTRRVLETLLDHRHPGSIATKGKLILRDLDLLRELATHNLVSVAVSITALDDVLKAKLEPRTASPRARFSAVAANRPAY